MMGLSKTHHVKVINEHSATAEEMVEAGYMGVDFIGACDLTPQLGEGTDAFRPAAVQVFLG